MNEGKRDRGMDLINFRTQFQFFNFLKAFGNSKQSIEVKVGNCGQGNAEHRIIYTLCVCFSTEINTNKSQDRSRGLIPALFSFTIKSFNMLSIRN